jgi:hypothetical protein
MTGALTFALLFLRSIYRTRGNLERNEPALINRSDDHARIVITMENVPTCQSAFLFAAGNGLPWPAAILKKNTGEPLKPNPRELGQELEVSIPPQARW